MALIQVGTAALRSPTGEFLPSEPIYAEVPQPCKAAEITEKELERLMLERFKEYMKVKKRGVSR